MRGNKYRNSFGYTLIEIITVIAILGILAMIAIPRFAMIPEKFREYVDETNAAVIARSLAAYIESENLAALPAWSDIPSNIIDKSITFKSLKYGGISRDAIPEIQGSIESFIIKGNGEQIYPK